MGWSDDVMMEYKVNKRKKKWSDRVVNNEDDSELFPTGITVKEVPVDSKKSRGGGGGHGKSTDIAPVKEEERTWFKSGAFSDGWDFGDITKTILGTTGDVVVGAAKGIGNLAEGLVDLGAYGAAGVGNMFGADTSGIKEFAKKQHVNDFLEPASDFVDKGSLLGDKADAIPEGLGYVGGIILTGGLGASAGLGTAGVTALTTSTIGASAMGSGMGEAYREGATDEEAITYGAISGIAEAGTELIFGGLGKTLKATGLSHGLSSADDVLAKKISSKISNQVAKNFAEFGVKAAAEGSEEVMAGVIQAIGKKVTYMDEEELSQLIEDENLFEQFIAGAVTSGIAQSGYVPGMTQGSLKEANKSGTDFITGFTQNEQTVLDKMVEKEIAAKEKDGTKLKNKEKNKITEELQEDLQKGLIDTADIESVFGGESYTRLQEAKERAENIKKEIAELENKPNAEITVKEMKRLNSLERRLEEIDIRTLQTELDNEVFSKIGQDNFLKRSYQERTQRSKLFEVTEQNENENIRNWDKSFVDAKSNNSQRAHNFNEFGRKIIQDKNIKMRAVNYETLVEEGKMKKFTDEKGNVSYKLKVNGEYRDVAVNGFKEKGVLNVNIQSNKAFETTVGHELGEFIKDSDADMYNQLKNIALELGKADGTYTEASIQKYADIYGENTDDAVDEYVNDKLGELFTNDAFIEQLSTKPNIIKTIINEIKHLVKMATAGSKEQRKLVSLQHKLESKVKEAYKNSDLTKETEQNADTKYSMTPGATWNLKELPTLFKQYADGISEIKYGKTSKPTNMGTVETGGKEYNLEAMVFNNDGRYETVIKAYDKGEQVGVLMFYNKGKTLVIRDVGMNREGTGLGTALVNRIIAEAEAQDYKEIIAENTTNTFNGKPSSTYWGRLGFKEQGSNHVLLLNDTDTKYSLSEDGKLVDDKGNDVKLEVKQANKDLLVMHNLTEEKLSALLDIEGIPTPSLAVTKAELNPRQFGGATIVYGKDTINPTDKRNEVYNADIYSPRFPETKNIVDAEAFEKYGDKLESKGMNYGYISSIREYIEDNDFEGVRRTLKRFLPENTTDAEIEALYKEAFSYISEKRIINPNIDIFTPSGTRRSLKARSLPYTLDNLVKIMTKKSTQGSESNFITSGTIRANMAQRFKSVDEIKDSKGNLKTSEEMNQIIEAKRDELDQLVNELADYYRYKDDNYIAIYDIVNDSINETARAKKQDISTLKAKLEENFILTENMPTELLQKTIDFLNSLKNMPTQYFEAKPQRAIYWGEEVGILIPNDFSAEVKQKAIDKGLNVIEYDPEIEGDYESKLNQSFEDAKFSLSDSNNTAPRQRGQTYSEDVKIQEVISDVEQTINNLFDRINNIYDRVTVDEEDFAPVNEASLPGLEQQFTESLDTLTDDLAPVQQETTQVDEDNTLDTRGVTLDTRELTNEMLSLGVAKKNNTKELKKAAEELNTLITEGKTDDTTLDTFVENLGTRLLVEHDPYEYDEVMQQVRDYLRNTRLFVGGMAKKGIGQWNEFRKANMGKMKLTNDPKATPIDAAYMELQEMFGTTLFPEDIYHPADQLEHLSELFGESKSNIPLYEYVESQYGRGAWEDIKQSFIDNIKSKVTEAAKTLEAKNYTDYYASIPVADNIGPEPTPPPVEEPKKKKAKQKSEEEQKVAQILAEEPKTEDDRNKRKWAIFKANVFDKGIVFEDVSLKHKNRELMGKWDYTLTSEARGQNAIGQGHYEYDPVSKTMKQVSKSLNDIRAEVENSGLATQFYEYIYHKHNIDRMSLERKAQEKIKDILRTSDYSHEELMKLANKRITEKTSEEDVKAIEFAKEYKALFEVKNKPVFGQSVTAEQSQAMVNDYELVHPEFMDFAQDIYNYTNAERQELVKSGVVSQETADLWQQMYPHYVPIRRAGHEGNAINVPLDTGRTGVNAPIKKATGGNKDILPLFDTMALRTLQTYRATAKNSFGVELMNTIGTKINSQNTTVDEVLDSVDTQEELLQEGKGSQKPTFTVFEDGVKHTFEITKDMYDALKPLSESSFMSKTITPLNVASSFHRGVLTEYNPVFMLTNAIKDSQDILLNSQHSAKTYVTIPEAYAQLVSKGYWYQEYMTHGGEQNSYFDSNDNTFKTENKGLKKILDIPPLSTISKLNNFIERAPRLAEYIASRKMGRSIEVSMLDAARVTTNFKAGGNFTKFLNRNGVTFLNASVQGLMQQVRNVREAKANGARGWMNLATKFAVAGLPAILLNALVWDDDEEYEELSDYVKQNYYIVGKTEEGKFIRIPKGRAVAVIQEAAQQIANVATGNDEVDLKAFIDLALTNLAPNSPIDNNILSPIMGVIKNEAWYGEDLVPTRLQDLPAAEQFDESTDAFSKWLGGVINVSPIKINYLLDQYTGGVGDVILPIMTPEAKSGAETLGEHIIAPLNSKFTTDPVLNNQNVSDFYDKSDELTTEAKKSAATDEDILRNKYMNSINDEMRELYKEKREVQNSSMSNSEKYEEVRRIQAEINKLAKKGLGNYDDVDMKSNYSTVGDREYYKTTDGEWVKVKDKETKALKDLGMSSNAKNRYFKAKNEISEIEDSDAEDKKTPKIKAIRNANLNDEQTAYLYDKYYASPEKLDVVLKTGIGMDAYLDLELQGFTADKDEEGKSINGSKKDKVFDYINTLDIGFEQRVILAKMYYPTYDEYNYDIIEYLNNDDSISYEDMVKILKTLEFEVDEDGNVWWD